MTYVMIDIISDCNIVTDIRSDILTNIMSYIMTDIVTFVMTDTNE